MPSLYFTLEKSYYKKGTNINDISSFSVRNTRNKM